jgi:polyphosphate kinase
LNKSSEIIIDQQNSWNNIKESLISEKIIIETKQSLDKNDIKSLRKEFTKNIFPALSPIAVDPAHPFPFIPNLGLSVVFQLNNESENNIQYVIVILPNKLNRFIKIEQDKDRYILLENVIEIFKDELFPDREVKGFNVFHLTRDSDIEIEEDAEDLMLHFESAVKTRRRGSVISLKMMQSDNQYLNDFVIEGLNVDSQDVIYLSHAIAIDHFMELYSIDKPKLKYPIYKERFPERINDYNGDCFAAIAAKDIVIHHPYETFNVVVDFLYQAAKDPDVVAIKQTLYRTSHDSPIVKALIEAAENGKSVTAVVELKARFDEESNIKWARNLESAGVQVVFGFVNLKTHAKVSMVVRRENNVLKSYVHFGTGNYHPITARVYSDLSYFTCNEDLCNDASYLFNYLTVYSSPKKYNSIIVSPRYLRKELIKLIRSEVENANNGLPSAIWAKLNSLIDPEIIDELYKASQAGVKIELVVRGICGLKPNIKGFSDNIKVKSIVGRYLEHTRIMCFANAHEMPSSNTKVFISSADWMQRNLNGRVEIMIPITNKTVHQQILQQIMIANLKDRRQSWSLESDGTYIKQSNDKDAFAAHDYFMDNPSLSGRGSAITQESLEKQIQKIHSS